MTTEKTITCIVCPIGCKIQVKIDGQKCDVVKGNKCKQGIDYAINEALNPKRVLTSSVLVDGGNWPLVSVKTSKTVPKGKIFSVLKEIKRKKVKAPVTSGEIIIKNVAGTKVDLIATKTVKAK